MSTIQIPVLFDVSGTANILGETQAAVISHHLDFTIGSSISIVLIAAF